MVSINIFTDTRPLNWELITKAPKKETGKFGGTNYRQLMLSAASKIDQLVILNMSQEKLISQLLDKTDIKPDEKQLILNNLNSIYYDTTVKIEDIYKSYNTEGLNDKANDI